MINTTDERILLSADEPAFMVLGATSYETPGDAPDTVKKTTVFTIRINEAMADEYDRRKMAFMESARGTDAERLKLDAYLDLLREVCERVCSKNATFTIINRDAAVVSWSRVELKGGKR